MKWFIASWAATADPPKPIKVFVLAGQSNMAGRGVVEPQDRVADLNVVMLDRTLHWVPAIDPIHYDKPIAGVGPGHSFARALVANDPNAHIGLIPAAVGGSPISSWEPGALDPATKTHPYDDALARAVASLSRQGQLLLKIIQRLWIAVLILVDDSDVMEHRPLAAAVAGLAGERQRLLQALQGRDSLSQA